MIALLNSLIFIISAALREDFLGEEGEFVGVDEGAGKDVKGDFLNVLEF